LHEAAPPRHCRSRTLAPIRSETTTRRSPDRSPVDVPVRPAIPTARPAVPPRRPADTSAHPTPAPPSTTPAPPSVEDASQDHPSVHSCSTSIQQPFRSRDHDDQVAVSGRESVIQSADHARCNRCHSPRFLRSIRKKKKRIKLSQLCVDNKDDHVTNPK